MLEYAEKLTLRPSQVVEEDAEALRRHGFGDRDILDVVLVTAYRNFVARVADGLGLDLEEAFTHLPGGLTRDLTVGRDLLARRVNPCPDGAGQGFAACQPTPAGGSCSCSSRSGV